MRGSLGCVIGALCAALGGCESRPPPGPDFAGEISFDLGPPIDLPTPFGFDGNFLPEPDPAATLVFSVTDESGAPLPSRVIFRPPPGSGFADSLTDPLPPPDDDHRTGIRTGATVSPGVVGAPEGLLLQTGYGSVAVPPGHYTLFFNRGPEYEAATVVIDVAAGVTQAVNVELHRSVDTRGWLAADMHIHAKLSFDSKVPLDRRAISMVTSGIELLVPTEHHGSHSFASLLPELGYGPDVAGSVAGNELNFKEGHAGVFPVEIRPFSPHGGSPPYQMLNPMGRCDPPIIGTNCMTAAEAFPFMRKLRGRGSLVTVNHPWFGSADLGYFTNIGWGAGTGSPFPAPLDTAGTFDALELLNGYWTRADAVAYILFDWFYLLSQGYHIAALGNSDTHGMAWVRAGWPRSYIRLPIDRPGDITDDLLYDAILHQRVVATTGPFVTVEVDGAQIGDTVRPRKAGEVTVRITADAPSWISLDHVVLFVNGRERRSFGVPPERRPRFTMETVEEITEDSFIVVLVSGDTPMPGDVVGEQAELDRQHTYPIAITNPIWVDTEGDGVVQPPVIVSRIPPWIPAMPTELGGQPQSRPQSLGPGAQGPAGRDCAPRPFDHPRLDAMDDLLHDAMPLIYP